jgi:hypothetical protein
LTSHIPGFCWAECRDATQYLPREKEGAAATK